MTENMLSEDFEFFMSTRFSSCDIDRIREFTSKFLNIYAQVNVLNCFVDAVEAEKLDEVMEALKLKFCSEWESEDPDIRGKEISPFVEIYEEFALPHCP